MHTFRLVASQPRRLDALLQRELPRLLHREISNSKIRRLIMAGMVSVNGVPRRAPAWVVSARATVTVAVDEARLFYEKDAGDIAFELTARDVLFEDDDIIVVNKPAFFPTEAGMVQSRDNLHAAVVRYLARKNPSLRNPPYAGIMHRLDRETSGVILFTKRRSANAACHAMFESHTASKRYRAVCCINADVRQPLLAAGASFSVDMPVGRVSGKSQAARWGRMEERDGGMASHTSFTVVATGLLPASSLPVAYIDAEPLTGRTHQIRVHLASVGLPILGDTLYGGAASDRVHLHAASLAFPHPATGERMTVAAPLPPSFAP